MAVLGSEQLRFRGGLVVSLPHVMQGLAFMCLICLGPPKPIPSSGPLPNLLSLCLRLATPGRPATFSLLPVLPTSPPFNLLHTGAQILFRGTHQVLVYKALQV